MSHTLAPSSEGTVMLTLGAGVGALLIHTAPGWHGREIEVSLEATPEARTHAAVRARHVGGDILYCAVIDALPEGRYVIWRDASTPMTRVLVRGGEVTEYAVPRPPAT
ncbi:hypothetical protein Ade02nite_14380 [Paractinoplanes deccanensis]|uniref:Phospholipase n=1 Tax=Paractinoplanes deccanensis TaxID=113561 RepID=A0ABQ3XYH8_9ACTN|nr:phospholipase [Actinoplanes deccanensis]GID72797.1 hypothetical protein Ade02nite_14380 [Actinoplanes deccanensis]